MSGRVVAVRRTGGFAGLTTQGQVDLDAEPDGGQPGAGATGETGETGELEALVARIDVDELDSLGTEPVTHADRYTYDFDLCGHQATVPEQHLTDDLRRVAELVLGR